MAGISILIYGSTYGFSFYGLNCWKNLFYFYNILAGFSCGICFIIAMLPIMHK